MGMILGKIKKRNGLKGCQDYDEKSPYIFSRTFSLSYTNN